MKIPIPLMDDICEGRCLPFVGAGFSLNAELPADLKMLDWKGLAKALSTGTKISSRLHPTVVAQKYERHFGRVQLVEEVRRALHYDKAKPGKAHLAFAMLPFDTVYTTNFDLLLEDAYSLQRRPFRSLVGELQMPFHSGQIASNIVKFHGDLRHEEHIIVTKKDYDQFLERYPVIATHLSAMLITRTPLFLGYSLSDPDFLHIRNVVRSRLGDFERMAYVVQFDVPAAAIREGLKKKVHIISLSGAKRQSRDEVLAEFFTSIQEHVDAKAGSRFRASRPDTFEPLEESVVGEAVSRSELTPVLGATSKLCFVMMPFEKKMDIVYRTLITPVVTELGLTVVRADEMQNPGSIMEQIRVAIQQARICIVDLTGTNANVMFELGLAQAAGKPTILISQDISKLPFDVRSQRIINYNAKSPQRSQDILRKALSLTLSDDNLAVAENLMASGHNRAAILEAFIVLDATIRKEAVKQNVTASHHKPLREAVELLSAAKALTREQVQQLSAISQIRNRAVHMTTPPNNRDATAVIDAAKAFLAYFNAEK
jgi:nucleoside 2-deoxyribosyltransferase